MTLYDSIVKLNKENKYRLFNNTFSTGYLDSRLVEHTFKLHKKGNKLYLEAARKNNEKVSKIRYDINTLNDLLDFFNNGLDCITNISLLQNNINILGYVLYDRVAEHIYECLHTDKYINNLNFKKVGYLHKFLSKAILNGYKSQCMITDLVYLVIDNKNNYFVVSEVDLILCDSEFFTFSFFGITCNNLYIDNLDITQLNNIESFFSNCTAKKIVLKNFNTKHIKSLDNLFSHCLNLEEINLDSLDTRNVLTMRYMFFYCEKLKRIDLSCLNTDNVTIIDGMFQQCYNLESVNMQDMYFPKLVSMPSCFFNCKNLIELNTNNLSTPKIRYISNWLYECEKLDTLDITFILDSLNSKNLNPTYWKNELVYLKVVTYRGQPYDL